MMSSAAPMALPWVEKYRPHMLSEVTGNEDAVMRLKSIARDGNMPHMILTVSTLWAAGWGQARGSGKGLDWQPSNGARHSTWRVIMLDFWPELCRAGIPGYRQDHVRAGSREGDARGLDQGGGAGAQRFRREVREHAFVGALTARMPACLVGCLSCVPDKATLLISRCRKSAGASTLCETRSRCLRSRR